MRQTYISYTSARIFIYKLNKQKKRMCLGMWVVRITMNEPNKMIDRYTYILWESIVCVLCCVELIRKIFHKYWLEFNKIVYLFMKLKKKQKKKFSSTASNEFLLCVHFTHK